MLFKEDLLLIKLIIILIIMNKMKFNLIKETLTY